MVFVCFFVNCSVKTSSEQTVIIVKVPPLTDEKLTQVENYWRFQHFLFPQQEIPNPLPQDLPNDDSILLVSIDEIGSLTLNSEDEGNVSDTIFLMKRLAEIFRQREEGGVYEPGKWKIVKVVGVKAAHSVKYGDFIKVIAAIKQSGADPIVLFTDGSKSNSNISTNINSK
jgi:biopolymer transport protein ExbD